jgi:8-oxo-dGTP pyrophosphatase MutT (NUDIX family)
MRTSLAEHRGSGVAITPHFRDRPPLFPFAVVQTGFIFHLPAPKFAPAPAPPAYPGPNLFMQRVEDVPSEPKDAATVVVVRPAPDGLEVFCVERHSKSGFMGGAVVFPGGKVDAADYDPRWEARTTPLAPRARDLGQDPVAARAFAVAALRETLEEAAILSTASTLDGTTVERLRRRLESGIRFADLMVEEDLVLDTGRLDPFARWITPTREPRRFDTRFYLLVLPEGQRGAHDRHETTESFWDTPRAVLERWERGEIVLAPPTSHTLELFSQAGTLEEARDIASSRSLGPVCPCFVQDGDSLILTLPGDPMHPEPVNEAFDPAAPTRFVLDGTRFKSSRADAAQTPSR